MSNRASFGASSRDELIRRSQSEYFDLLIIGGGITGAAAARDATSRGLNVCLIEKSDFGAGTSSRSSKLVHGGLRYLENFEFRLVFEALSERSLLLETLPHIVRPMPFLLPVYEGDRVGMNKLSAGMWLYDILSRFRAPKLHKRYGRASLQQAVPILNAEGLAGGFEYYDATMWDDVMVLDLLADAHLHGAVSLSYTEARRPQWNPEGSEINGYWVRDEENIQSPEYLIRAKRVISCVGPWTDRIGLQWKPNWAPQLMPSQGIHLVFPWSRIPLDRALVMSHPSDGRISFVVPRKDYGEGVTIVGTTDSAVVGDLENLAPSDGEVLYLMQLLQEYFPTLQLTLKDLTSFYVGVRPLVKPPSGEGVSLQKVSREHSIEEGPGRITWVAGGKYTTHRIMGREIVDHAIQTHPELPGKAGASKTEPSPFPQALKETSQATQRECLKAGKTVPSRLFDLYGAAAEEVAALTDAAVMDIQGFPSLSGQLRFAIRHRCTLHLSDFYLRRAPLLLADPDHGRSFLLDGAKILAQEIPSANVEHEIQQTLTLIDSFERSLEQWRHL